MQSHTHTYTHTQRPVLKKIASLDSGIELDIENFDRIFPLSNNSRVMEVKYKKKKIKHFTYLKYV